MMRWLVSWCLIKLDLICVNINPHWIDPVGVFAFVGLGESIKGLQGLFKRLYGKSYGAYVAYVDHAYAAIVADSLIKLYITFYYDD